MIYENLEVSGSLTSDRVINRPPRGNRANRIGSPLSGSLYLEESTSGSFLMLYTGVSNIDNGWERIAAQETEPIAFKYRQVFLIIFESIYFVILSIFNLVQFDSIEAFVCFQNLQLTFEFFHNFFFHLLLI
jgi:hypothetical protein